MIICWTFHVLNFPYDVQARKSQIIFIFPWIFRWFCLLPGCGDSFKPIIPLFIPNYSLRLFLIVPLPFNYFMMFRNQNRRQAAPVITRPASAAAAVQGLPAARSTGFWYFTLCFYFGMPETAKNRNSKDTLKWIEIRANVPPYACFARSARLDEIREHISLY